MLDKIRRTRKRRGYSLVELLAVIAMVGILAALAAVSYRKWLTYSRVAGAKDCRIPTSGRGLATWEAGVISERLESAAVLRSTGCLAVNVIEWPHAVGAQPIGSS